MIEGVKTKPLVRHLDDRGYVMEILRCDDELFGQFGQVYVSTCHPGVVKAWHCHEKQTDNFCVVRGNAKLGLYDDREDSPTKGQTMSLVIGELNPVLVQIPPLVWHGQMCVGNETSYLINVPTQPYNPENPDELRRDADDPEIDFQWLPESR
ncbi:MAG: dTDP-4-dehydrorhamnose 3,5-epimerase family protein [Armatimonadota bacterium]